MKREHQFIQDFERKKQIFEEFKSLDAELVRCKVLTDIGNIWHREVIELLKNRTGYVSKLFHKKPGSIPGWIAELRAINTRQLSTLEDESVKSFLTKYAPRAFEALEHDIKEEVKCFEYMEPIFAQIASVFEGHGQFNIRPHVAKWRECFEFFHEKFLKLIYAELVHMGYEEKKGIIHIIEEIEFIEEVAKAYFPQGNERKQKEVIKEGLKTFKEFKELHKYHEIILKHIKLIFMEDEKRLKTSESLAEQIEDCENKEENMYTKLIDLFAEIFRTIGGESGLCPNYYEIFKELSELAEEILKTKNIPYYSVAVLIISGLMKANYGRDEAVGALCTGLFTDYEFKEFILNALEDFKYSRTEIMKKYMRFVLEHHGELH